MTEEINSHPIKNKYYKHLWYILIAPAYIIAFFILENIISNDFPVDKMFLSHIPLDDMIPFCEYFVIAYCLWYIALVAMGLYLIFCDAEGFKKFMIYIGASFFTMIIIFAVFPNYQDMRPNITGEENIFCHAVKRIYDADTYTNVLPSGHVLGTMVVNFAVLDCKTINKHKWLVVLSIILGFFICISTVFIKQHSILDILVTIPLGFIWWVIIYKVIFKKKKVNK